MYDLFKRIPPNLLYLIHILWSFLAFCALVSYFTDVLDWNLILSIPIALIVASAPLVGQIFGFIGATEAWDWSTDKAIYLFFGHIIFSLSLIIIRALWEFLIKIFKYINYSEKNTKLDERPTELKGGTRVNEESTELKIPKLNGLLYFGLILFVAPFILVVFSIVNTPDNSNSYHSRSYSNNYSYNLQESDNLGEAPHMVDAPAVESDTPIIINAQDGEGKSLYVAQTGFDGTYNQEQPVDYTDLSVKCQDFDSSNIRTTCYKDKNKVLKEFIEKDYQDSLDLLNFESKIKLISEKQNWVSKRSNTCGYSTLYSTDTESNEKCLYEVLKVERQYFSELKSEIEKEIINQKTASEPAYPSTKREDKTKSLPDYLNKYLD